MVASNLKEETMKLMDKRTGLETEMDAIIHACVSLVALVSPVTSSILRSDIDIPTVRAGRHKLSVLRNDHKEMTNKIDRNIQLLHSARLAPAAGKESAKDGSAGTSPSINNSVAGGCSSAMDMNVVVSKPFAMVDEISEASPAAEDGLQLGDQIVKFGNVEIGDNVLQRLAAESQNSQGKSVSLVLMRQGALVNLNVTPRAWPGRGLLGCHFRILRTLFSQYAPADIYQGS